MKLVTIPCIDLAIHHGGAGAPDLATVCAGANIMASAPTAAETESLWAFGDVARLSDNAAREAIAVWLLWLAESNGKADIASGAFAAWLADREFNG